MAKNFSVQIELKGVEKTLLKLKGAGKVAGKAAAGALYIEGEKIMAESKDRYVPVKHGNLMASGHVALPKQTDKEVWRIDLGYGGPSVDYAIVQHENMKYRHKRGTSKYLEKPALAAAPKIGKRVGKKIMFALRKLQQTPAKGW